MPIRPMTLETDFRSDTSADLSPEPLPKALKFALDPGAGDMSPPETGYSPTRRKESIVTNMTEILDGFLYLGGARDAVNAAGMARIGITHFLCVAAEMQVPEYIVENFHYLKLPMEDKSKERLQNHFNMAFAFIEDVRSRQEKVLVFCRKGISRSASIVIGYLMKHCGKTYQEASEHVRHRRHEVDPNLTFLQQLKSYEESLHLPALDEAAVGAGASDDEPFHAEPSFAGALSPTTTARLVQGDYTPEPMPPLT